MRRVTRAILFLGLALLAGCTRGPEPARLEADVQSRVDALFGRRVLEVESFRRQGSAPFRAADDGTRQVIVYYNARFRMKEAYDPSDWQGLGPGMITSAIGAADEGVTGLKAGRNEPGTELRAYGSIVYRAQGDGWAPAETLGPRPTAAVAATEESDAEAMMRRLAELVQKTPARRDAKEAIITEELAQALANIRMRTERGQQRIVIAAGPEGGEYARFLASLIGRLDRKSPIEIAATAGSVENAMLVDRDQARAGLVQSDVAAAAVTGDGIFAGTGPLGHLRAVTSLFPEPVHVVVRADSGITALADLAGKRVSLGRVASGTRQTALRLLEAAGISLNDVEGVEAPTPQQALARLATGEVDAVIEVVSAPWRQLELAMQSGQLRLLPLDAATIANVTADVHGLVPLDIPGRTYPGEPDDLPTVAATALLVARDDVPDALVRDTLDLMYASAASGGAGVQATRLSKARATTGITIPMHPAAAAYFGRPD
ncbi:MAG: TAXI family TRAP transporter solute-binding subunit [Steroidobacteraceae bacterium]